MEALAGLTSLTEDEKKFFKDYCDKGVSMAELVRDEFKQTPSCTAVMGEQYIQEENDQMTRHVGRKYDLNETSVAEHVFAEQNLEPDHSHSLYAPSPGPVKWFQEWLEGHHPSLGCMFGSPNDVPPDNYYIQLAEGRKDAIRYRDMLHGAGDIEA